ncbi:MAG: glycosyltransferase family 2 protein [Anaerolineae bacterium]|nr:glycosyltransferase family 2 protein [Anaerolineae bacterium]MDQ7035233.1 glycosyltransferase family 2 protein [Anaerolineae bacterium]
MPDLSIVIVNYNTRDKLRDCLHSLIQHRGKFDLDIIVVDNDSTDGSVAMIHETFADEVRLIEPNYNTWFSGGNNRGVRAATSDIVLLLNADTLIQSDTLQVMYDYLIAQDAVAAVTCRQRHPDGEWLQTCSMQPQYLDLLLGYTGLGIVFRSLRDKRRLRMWYDGWQRDSNQSVEVAPGSCIMTHRDLLLSFGIFDETLKLYFTDDDLCRSILNSGQEIHFLADTILLHYEKSSIQGMTSRARQIYFDDMLVFCRKHYGLWRTLLLTVLHVPTRIAMTIKQKISPFRGFISSHTK